VLISITSIEVLSISSSAVIVLNRVS
jgi:hypothetical protein